MALLLQVAAVLSILVVTNAMTLRPFPTCVTDVSQCTANSMPIGQYPHCSDCTMFIKCDGSYSGAFVCPDGLNYAVDTGVCDYPSAAVCGTSTSTTTTTTTTTAATTAAPTPALVTDLTQLEVFSQCVSSSMQCITHGVARGQYPHCTDCAQFIKCDGLSSAAFTCGTGLHYDVNQGVCDFTTSAVCGTNAPPVTPGSGTTADVVPLFASCVNSHTECVTNGLARGQYPVCGNCNMFVKCDASFSASFTCQSGLNYDVGLGLCANSAEVTCTV